MMIRLEGDHSAYHCGSAAVFETLTRLCDRKARLAGPGEDYDALVVNGEGSMHHGSKSFHTKMALLRDAQDQGKKTFLLNSLWQQNPSEYDAVLQRLDGLHVRGRCSADGAVC